MTKTVFRVTLGAFGLFAILAALWCVGSGLGCAAVWGSDQLPSRGFCGPHFGQRRHATPKDGAAAAAIENEIQHEDTFYAAVIDTIYQPQRYATPVHRGGIVLLESRTVSGLEYLGDDTVIRSLRRLSPGISGDSLAAAFRAANAAPHNAPSLYSYHATQMQLDSSTVRQLLGDGAMDASARSVVDNVLAGMPLDSLPDVLALSRPAVTSDGDSALIFASLRARRSRERDHLEAAAFLFVRRDGFRWTVTDEIPLPRLRAR